MSFVSLSRLLCASAERPVCIDGDEVIRLSRFRRRVAALAARFSRTCGTRHVLCLADPYDFVCAWFALLVAGKTPVIPVLAARGHLADLSTSFDGVIDRLDDFANVDDTTPADRLMTIPDDAEFVIFTSGTSGSPKAVRKRLREIDAELHALEAHWGARLGPAAVLGCVPHHHFYGLIFSLLWPLAAGRAFDRGRYATPAELVARMHALGPCAIVATPAHLSRWPRLDDFAALAPVCVFSAGAPLSRQAVTEYIQRLGFAPDEVYGSTETGALAWRRQSEHDAWTPLPGVNTEPGANGCLVAHLPPHGEAAAAACHHTDDAVRFDGDGRFHLLGRTDRVAKIDGRRISLAEAEARLAQHAFVRAAGIVRLEPTQARSREQMGAVVELSEAGASAWRGLGRHAMIAQLARFLSEHVPVVPRRWRFRAALPFDDRGKLSARALAREFTAQPGGPDIFAEIADGARIECDLHVPETLVQFDGHFPDMKILPGVVQLDWAIRLASRHVTGVRDVVCIERLKFLAPVRPGASLKLALEHEPARSRVRFEYRLREKPCASGVIVYRSVDV